MRGRRYGGVGEACFFGLIIYRSKNWLGSIEKGKEENSKVGRKGKWKIKPKECSDLRLKVPRTEQKESHGERQKESSNLGH